jgi:hypothetical protein
MTTSVWPSAAIASADANGSIVRTTPLFRLDDAKSQLTRKSAAVATITVARPRDSSLLDPRGITGLDWSDPPLRVSDLTWRTMVTSRAGVHKSEGEQSPGVRFK